MMKKIILKSPEGNPFDTKITNEDGEELHYVKDITFTMGSGQTTEINITLFGVDHEINCGNPDITITNLDRINKDLKALGYTSIRKISIANKE